jgi:murein DD-endopeptidase MepM/ murein hydrolase activator NlpD
MSSIIFIITIFASLTLQASELPFVAYPFHPARGILCDQGAQSPEGNSHTHSNTLYALDLATPSSADPGGLYASGDGMIISFNKCVKHNTKCGAGFGNHVKLLRADGILVLYAHLESMQVKTGDLVKSGQFLGVEGNTGATGRNNRHLHFSVHSDWKKNGFHYYKKHIGSVPKSIPFKMNICQEKYQPCNDHALDIRLLKCKRITNQTEWVSTF